MRAEKVLVAISSGIAAFGLSACTERANSFSNRPSPAKPSRPWSDGSIWNGTKATIKGLTQFGDRLHGTDRNRAAIDWIEAELKAMAARIPSV